VRWSNAARRGVRLPPTALVLAKSGKIIMSRYAEKLAEIWVRAAPMWLSVETKSGEGERKLG